MAETIGQSFTDDGLCNVPDAWVGVGGESVIMCDVCMMGGVCEWCVCVCMCRMRGVMNGVCVHDGRSLL